MHLLGVFHPDLHTHEQRENYIGKLRLVYGTLRNKWVGDLTLWNSEVYQLSDSIRRDAIRTDPTETFLAGAAGFLEDDNLEKLVRVTMIYTLEHPEIKYTQGMTDMLSPLLYVMEREEDAYICFAALFTRLKENFSLWCDGALNKIERLKHLCEVLDPELFAHMTLNVTEDPFILFFGMVLIECRREFSFQDSLHLFEVIAAVVFRNRKLPKTLPSLTDWASYMTTDSNDVILQVFGEINSPYASHPLEQEVERRRSKYSHNSSDELRYSSELLHHGSRGSFAREIPGCISQRAVQPPDCLPFASQSTSINRSLQSSSITVTARERSNSLPNTAFSPIVEISIEPSMISAHSDGHINTHAHVDEIEDELQDSLGELQSGYVNERISTLPITAEMSDMSSVCSSSKGSNGLIGTCTSTNSSYVSLQRAKGRKNAETSSTTLANVAGGPVFSDVKSCFITEPCTQVTRGFSTDEEEEKEQMKSSQLKPLKGPPLSLQISGSGSKTSKVHNVLLPQELKSELEQVAISDVVEPSTVAEKEEESTCQSSYSAPMISHSLPNTSFLTNETPIRGLEHPAPVYADDPVPPRTQRRRASTDSHISPLPSFFSAMDRMRNQPNSLEASIEVSHVISQLVLMDRRPNVNRESSLQIKISNNYSLFICLAILVSHRTEILDQQMDFVNLSMVLSANGAHNLSSILKLARQLYDQYTHFQSVYFNSLDQTEYWLDEDPDTIASWDPSTVSMRPHLSQLSHSNGRPTAACVSNKLN